MTRRKRAKLVPEDARTSVKKRVIAPTRQMPLMKLRPRRPRPPRTSTIDRPPRFRGRSARGEAHVHGVWPRRVMEGHGTVAVAQHELAHQRLLRRPDLVGRAGAHDDAFRDEVE